MGRCIDEEFGKGIEPMPLKPVDMSGMLAKTAEITATKAEELIPLKSLSALTVDELCEHLTQIAKQTCVVWKQLATTEEDF